jgi:malate/lactate dehydrogenase
VKVTILGGGGGVGSSTAFNLLLLGDELDIVLADRRPEKVLSHTMDLEQVLELGGTGRARPGVCEDAQDSDVVVVTASAPLTVNVSRLDYLRDNAEILLGVGDLLARAGDSFRGVVIVVTNPVDPLCTLLQERAGLDRRRVLGYTLNDSLRLRTGIAAALGVDAGTVEAWVLGEHGDACVPLFEHVRVDGAPATLTEAERAEADGYLRSWYVRHVALDSGRTSTWTSGRGLARMISSIVHDTGELWPASVVLAGEYGVEDVSLGVPLSLGRDGVREVHEWPLTAAEQESFSHAASVVRDACASGSADPTPAVHVRS